MGRAQRNPSPCGCGNPWNGFRLEPRGTPPSPCLAGKEPKPGLAAEAAPTRGPGGGGQLTLTPYNPDNSAPVNPRWRAAKEEQLEDPRKKDKQSSKQYWSPEVSNTAGRRARHTPPSSNETTRKQPK